MTPFHHFEQSYIVNNHALNIPMVAISLTVIDTENPDNVGFYEHFNYKHTDTEGLDDLTLYTLFRQSKKMP